MRASRGEDQQNACMSDSLTIRCVTGPDDGKQLRLGEDSGPSCTTHLLPNRGHSSPEKTSVIFLLQGSGSCSASAASPASTARWSHVGALWTASRHQRLGPGDPDALELVEGGAVRVTVDVHEDDRYLVQDFRGLPPHGRY